MLHEHRLSKTHAKEEEDAPSTASPPHLPRLMVETMINGTPIQMELDTASTLLIIPDCLYRHHVSILLSPISVVKTTVTLCSFIY